MHGGGDAGVRGPEEGGRGAVGFDLRPEVGFEGGVFGALFLDYVGVGDGGGEVGAELEGAGGEEVGDEIFPNWVSIEDVVRQRLWEFRRSVLQELRQVFLYVVF